MSQFAFDFFRRGDGARDFLPQDLAITLTQTVDGGFEGAFVQAELSGQKSIRLGVMFADQAGFEGFEEIGLAFGAAFGGEPLEHGFQQREGPAALKDLIGRGRVGRFLPVARLGGVELQGHEPGGPAALLGVGSIPLVGEKIPEGGEQKGAKPAALAVGAGQPVPLQQTGEEFLGEILGIRRVVTAPANIGIKWIPIGGAKMR